MTQRSRPDPAGLADPTGEVRRGVCEVHDNFGVLIGDHGVQNNIVHGGIHISTPSAPPPTYTLVRDADLRLLGVHRAIDAEGAVGELPTYVPRDTDTQPRGVRDWLVDAAATRGGMMLLVGWSSVGKTRTACEAVLALLPDWRLVYPRDVDEIGYLAAHPSPGTVVWLDEIHRLLETDRQLTAGLLRNILNLSRPTVVVATMWPDRYTAYTAPPLSGPDVYGREREVLELAHMVRVDDRFSEDEVERARVLAATDPRLRAALDIDAHRVPQVLAGVPQLLDRWEYADEVARAVLTGAAQAATFGFWTLSRAFLADVAQSYCDVPGGFSESSSRFEWALRYATTPVHGVDAALTETDNPRGYRVADYLVQHANLSNARVPAAFWQACERHIENAGDLRKAAAAARHRALYSYADSLYRLAIRRGTDHEAALDFTDLRRYRFTGFPLASSRSIGAIAARALDPVRRAYAEVDRLVAKGSETELRRLIDDREDHRARKYAAERLAARLGAQGRVDDLRAWVEEWSYGSRWAYEELVRVLDVEVPGCEEALRQELPRGDPGIEQRLTSLLARQGRVEDLVELGHSDGPICLEARAALSDLLVREERERELRDLILRGYAGWLLEKLVLLLASTGRGTEAKQVWRHGLTPDGETAPQPRRKPGIRRS
jgi:hypothetical protein